MTERVLHAEMEFRSLDEQSRSASYVASTERAVNVGWGAPEVLRMTGARLQRFRKNPVVLDTHNRFDLGSVIGRADVKVQGRELHATITYANTERGNLAWSLVKDGMVRAVSIGYSVNPQRVTRLREGETDGEGDSLVTGPANVVREWTLLEVSNVPIPADEDAVRRSFYEAIPEEGTMASNISLTAAMGERGEAQTPAPTPAPAAPVVKAPAPVAEIEEERAARALEATKRAVLAICPRGLEGFAEGLVLEGKSLEECRKALLAERARTLAPVGTPEPPKVEAETTANRGEKPLPADVTDDVIVRSFENLR